MEGVISYRPSIGKKKLQDAVKKLSFENTNQFIDFAVMSYLAGNADPKIGKLMTDLVEAVYQHAPLKFRKPTLQEHQEIMEKVKQLKAGKIKGVRMHPIKEDYQSISFSKPSPQEASKIKKRAEAMRSGKAKSIPLSDVIHKLENMKTRSTTKLRLEK